MKYVASVLLAFCFIVGSEFRCLADAPVCTGDRHYDGVACCPVVDPPAVTTTTLPDQPHVVDGCPAGCIDVTDIPQCPDVVCGSGTITINRCPTVVFPKYERCRMDAKNREHCPIKDHPRRFFKPMGQGK